MIHACRLLSPLARVVLAAVVAAAPWRAGQAALADVIGRSPRTLRRVLAELRAGGWIARVPCVGPKGRAPDALAPTDLALALAGGRPLARPALPPRAATEALPIASGAESFRPADCVRHDPEVLHVRPAARAGAPVVRLVHHFVPAFAPPPLSRAAVDRPRAGQRRHAAPASLDGGQGAYAAGGGPRGRQAGPATLHGGAARDGGPSASGGRFDDAGAAARAGIRDPGPGDVAPVAVGGRGRAQLGLPFVDALRSAAIEVSGGARAAAPSKEQTDRASTVGEAGAPPVAGGTASRGQAPTPPPSPAYGDPPGRGAAEGKKRGKVSPEERAEREADKAKRAEAAERKRRGEDVPCLPEVLAAWRAAVSTARGIPASEVVLASRAISAARGYVGHLLRSVAPGRSLEEADRAEVVRRARALFASALAGERPAFPLGLELVCRDPDRYQGAPAGRGPRTAEERRDMARQPAIHVKPGKEEGNLHRPTEADRERVNRKLAAMGIRNA